MRSDALPRFRVHASGLLFVHDPSSTSLPRGAEWRRVLPRLDADWRSPYRLRPEQTTGDGWTDLELRPITAGGAAC